MISASAGRYASGDLAGLSGLQATYDERLAGRAGLLILAVGPVAAGSPADTADVVVRMDHPRNPAVRD